MTTAPPAPSDRGEPVYDHVIPARQPWSRVIPAGHVLRITDIEGSQAVDFLCYANDDREERYHMPNTIKAAGAITLTTGHVLYSDLARPLFTIVEDSFGAHDTLGGCCSVPSNKLLYGADGVPGCRENFLAALAEYGMGRRDIVPNLNFFMEVPVAGPGAGQIAPGRSRAGEYLDLLADRDILAVISNCPQMHNPCTGFNPTPTRVSVFPAS